jgi:peptide chain release factor 3
MDEAKRDPILAAVGQLQFEVVQFRLQSEYGVETRIELLPYSLARWVEGGWPALEKAGRLFNTITVKDSWNQPVLLFRNEWNLHQVQEDQPDLVLKTIAPVTSGKEPLSL